MVRHLADVERSWFVEVFAGLHYDREFGNDEHPDGEFDVTDPGLPGRVTRQGASMAGFDGEGRMSAVLGCT